MATKKSSSKSSSKTAPAKAKPASSVRSKAVMGYMPNDVPPLGQNILLGFQHVLTMFPATVFVAAFCGFHVGTVLFSKGPHIVGPIVHHNHLAPA